MVHDLVTIIPATEHHLHEIILLLKNDFLGRTRERLTDNIKPYQTAFAQMSDDPNNTIYVALIQKKVVACMQLTFITGLSLSASKRAQIEGVRVHKDFRNLQLGEKLFEFAIEKAKLTNCGVIQLTTNKLRTDAHRFYDRLGFVDSHIGYKLNL